MATHRQVNADEIRELRERFVTLAALGYGWQELTQACGEHGGFARKGVEADFRFYRLNHLQALRKHMKDVPVTDEARGVAVKPVTPEIIVQVRPPTAAPRPVFEFDDEPRSWQDHLNEYRRAVSVENPGRDILGGALDSLRAAHEACDVGFIREALGAQVGKVEALIERVDELVLELLEEAGA